jgi:hypothetical protein
MNFFKTLLFSVILLLANSALAFDDNREGFILGLGAGLHSIKNDYSLNGLSYLTESKSGLATSLKVGAGITNQFSLYFVRNSSWFSTPVTNGATTKDAHAVVGISGIGATYYFEPAAPSGYMLAAVGGSDYAFPFESNITTKKGGAFMLGGGYEFDKHVMFEVTLLATRVADPDNSYNKIQSSALQFTLNYMFY